MQDQCLAHSKYSVNISFYFYYHQTTEELEEPRIATPQLFLPPSPKLTSTSPDLHSTHDILIITSQGTLKSSPKPDNIEERTKGSPRSQSASPSGRWGPERARKREVLARVR